MLTRTLALGAALVAIGCGPARPSPDRPMNEIATDGGFLGWKLGHELSPGDSFEKGDRGRDYLLRRRVTVGGRPADRVTFRLRDKTLKSVEISFSADGEKASDELMAWGKKLCARFPDQPEEFTPSPLGTPEPGEEWDPVITDNVTCQGQDQGVHHDIRMQRNSASDFTNANVTVRLTAP
jgi:hypothetical protein